MYKVFKNEKGNFLKAAAYLLPALIILITFNLYPAVKVFLMSFYTKYNYFKHQVYGYGLGNYRSYKFNGRTKYQFWRRSN